MNTNRIIVIGFAAFLIASCCTYDPKSDGPSNNVQVDEFVGLVGFDPGGKHADDEFINFLHNHNSQVYRVQRYENGNPVGQAMGSLKDIDCKLEGRIEYWAKNTMGGKDGKGGATKYTGQLGASCSTSCKPPELEASVKISDDFRQKYGSGTYHSKKKHHHDD